MFFPLQFPNRKNHQLSTCFKSELCPTGILFAITATAGLFFSNTKTKRTLPRINGEEVFVSDVESSEKLRFKDAIKSSLVLSGVTSDASSSVEQQIFCEICLESKESPEMFRNDKCPHRFCYDCTSRYIVFKVQENVEKITCPGMGCPAMLNISDCRTMIPSGSLLQWDETLCLSLIPESKVFYCPFLDCSTMLVNEHHPSEVVRKTICVACKRSFCMECQVPWHVESTCQENLNKFVSEKEENNDKMMNLLAKRMGWQKCPKCKVFVEKIVGCDGVKCRCGYRFCYNCGSKWWDNGYCAQGYCDYRLTTA